MKEWIEYQPDFEYKNISSKIHGSSAWNGHFNFGYNLVRYIEPDVLVELGTHYGGSFFSFCQAAKDGCLKSKLYAIDTFSGDVHAGAYNNEVFETVEKVAQKIYNNQANLMKMYFDEGALYFEDESIDILHIDGLHTYDAVKHDYEMWLPKVKPGGIVLFHDTTVLEYGFGVHLLWKELSTLHPNFEFEHSSGLGVLFPKGLSDLTRKLIEHFKPS